MKRKKLHELFRCKECINERKIIKQLLELEIGFKVQAEVMKIYCDALTAAEIIGVKKK